MGEGEHSIAICGSSWSESALTAFGHPKKLSGKALCGGFLK